MHGDHLTSRRNFKTTLKLCNTKNQLILASYQKTEKRSLISCQRKRKLILAYIPDQSSGSRKLKCSIGDKNKTEKQYSDQ